jgi:hypothetical protein
MVAAGGTEESGILGKSNRTLNYSDMKIFVFNNLVPKKGYALSNYRQVRRTNHIGLTIEYH